MRDPCIILNKYPHSKLTKFTGKIVCKFLCKVILPIKTIIHEDVKLNTHPINIHILGRIKINIGKKKIFKGNPTEEHKNKLNLVEGTAPHSSAQHSIYPPKCECFMRLYEQKTNKKRKSKLTKKLN